MRTGINYAKCAVTAALFAIFDAMFLPLVSSNNFSAARMSNNCRKFMKYEPKNGTKKYDFHMAPLLGGHFVCSC